MSFSPIEKLLKNAILRGDDKGYYGIFLQGNILYFLLLIECLQRDLLIVKIKEKNKQRVTQESKMGISEEIMNQKNKKHFIKDRKEENSLCL